MTPATFTFHHYAGQAAATATYPEASEQSIAALTYLGLGIAGEAGEVADIVKKILRDDQATITDQHRDRIAAEVGDVLWYCARIAAEIGVPLATIAHQNTVKLADRQARGVIGGSGDNR